MALEGAGHTAGTLSPTSPSSLPLWECMGGAERGYGGLHELGPHCGAPTSHLSDRAPSTSPPISMPAMKIDWASSFSLPELHTKSHCTRERGPGSSVQPGLSSALSLGPRVRSLSQRPPLASPSLVPFGLARGSLGPCHMASGQFSCHTPRSVLKLRRLT